MRSFRVGYILTLSFLLLLSVVALTFGFYPPPIGPKPPEYPVYTSSTATTDLEVMRQTQIDYENSRKQYEADQKVFLQQKIVPYAQNVFTVWVIILIVFQVLGVFLAFLISEVVGGAYSFSGVWAVIFGPLGGLLWFVNSLVSSLGSRATQTYSADMIWQSVGISSLAGVIILTVLGIIFMSKFRKN